MKYPHTGLYYYCKHLGRALVETSNEQNEFCFYTPRSIGKIFGDEQCYIEQRAIHKYLFPDVRNIEVWHSTHQSSEYSPIDKKVKIVLTIHDLNYLYDKSKSEAKRFNYIAQLKKKIQRADHIVAISNFTLADVQKFFDLKDKSYNVIYNGCNIDEIKNLSLPQQVPPAPFLFTIGTITDKKNFHVLPPLLSRNEMYLVIAGITQSKEYQEKIISTAKQFKVADRIIFTGPVSENDKQWYLKHCTAFVFPSISEGFGLPVVEAMYFGKPVLLSTHTSLPEIGGSAAYYFKSFDEVEMQNTLNDCLHHFENNKCIDAIKDRASLFNWNKSAEEYRSVYKNLLV
jgi:glycosyltransferase involved in cell wall biosynthesis